MLIRNMKIKNWRDELKPAVRAGSESEVQKVFRELLLEVLLECKGHTVKSTKSKVGKKYYQLYSDVWQNRIDEIACAIADENY